MPRTLRIALFIIFVVFFFKQKTAYEMRISDWSSDVCSSDLIAPRHRPAEFATVASSQMFASELAGIASRAANDDIEFLHLALLFGVAPSSFAERHPGKTRRIRGQSFGTRIQQKARSTDVECVPGRTAPGNRSDEHTSELQYLMRIS